VGLEGAQMVDAFERFAVLQRNIFEEKAEVQVQDRVRFRKAAEEGRVLR